MKDKMSPLQLQRLLTARGQWGMIIPPVPEFGWLMHPGKSPGLGGIDYRPEQLGRVAVEEVVAQIHRNERGSPAIPQTVAIDGIWLAPGCS